MTNSSRSLTSGCTACTSSCCPVSSSPSSAAVSSTSSWRRASGRQRFYARWAQARASSRVPRSRQCGPRACCSPSSFFSCSQSSLRASSRSCPESSARSSSSSATTGSGTWWTSWRSSTPRWTSSSTVPCRLSSGRHSNSSSWPAGGCRSRWSRHPPPSRPSARGCRDGARARPRAGPRLELLQGTKKDC